MSLHTKRNPCTTSGPSALSPRFKVASARESNDSGRRVADNDVSHDSSQKAG